MNRNNGACAGYVEVDVVNRESTDNRRIVKRGVPIGLPCEIV